MKFEVGDRVRLVNNEYYDNLAVNTLGFVVGVEEKGVPWPVKVQFDGEKILYVCSVKELEKV